MAARSAARGRTRAFLALAVLGFGPVGAALVSQHAYGLEPCAWCVLQRFVFALIGIAGVLGLAWHARAGAVVAGLLGLALAVAGAAAALWMYAVASKSASCNLTLADRIMNATTLPTLLPEVFEARASCADAAVPLLGIDYALWALAAFVLCAAVALAALKRR